MPKINEKKYKNIILYFFSKLGGIIRGKKKLAKLLYFADFDFFEKYENFFNRRRGFYRNRHNKIII